MTSTKAIFFDLDGTLLRFDRPYRELLAETFTAVEGEVREAWLERYTDAFFELFGACEPDPVERAFASTDAPSSPTALAEALHVRERAACRPPEAVHDDLERLSESHALGVLTNGLPGWQRAKLREHDLERHFDVVVATYEVGAHKPNVAPFRVAEERLPARAYAMVGDADADVEGAEAAGWAAYRYTGSGFGELPAALGWG